MTKTITTPFRLLDTHCHLDLFPSPGDIVSEIVSNRICTIAVTNAPFLFAHTKQFADRTPFIYPALGLHPELVASHQDQLGQFHELLPQTKFVGEIGLDYVTKDQDNHRQQQKVFESILGWCADDGNKVLTVHSRRSAPDVVAAIGDKYPGSVILHWYSGALRDLRKGLKFGFFFSINPSMVRSESGRRIISEIPHDRILTETDGPFAKQDGVPATPSAINNVVSGLAEIWNKSIPDVEDLIVRNANNALSLDM